MTITLKIDNPHLEEQLLLFLKEQKQGLEEVTIEALQFFMNAFKKKDIKKIDIDSLPSSVDKYVGIVGENEVDLEYKDSRANYLARKYLPFLPYQK
jgi:hypothetical protein